MYVYILYLIRLFVCVMVGTRARQRSRYLRFARPPQEKQLIAARKRTIKEKKFLKLSAEVGVVALLLLLLCTIVFREFSSVLMYMYVLFWQLWIVLNQCSLPLRFICNWKFCSRVIEPVNSFLIILCSRQNDTSYRSYFNLLQIVRGIRRIT